MRVGNRFDKRESLFFWGPIFGMALVVSSSSAIPITVGPGAEDYSHIQEALNAANAGDEIIVSASVYTENLSLFSKDIVLRSTDPTNPSVVEATIIDGNAADAVITLNGTITPACVIEGFTITNGFQGQNGDGGGIDGGGTAATIRYNVIRNNSVGPFQGMGVGTGGGLDDCDGLIEYNRVLNNIARVYGGGFQGCDGTIRNNLVQNNRTSGGGGGGGFARCNATIRNNLILNNSADFYGGGLWACNGPLQNNTIYGNRAFNIYQDQVPIMARGGGTAFCSGSYLNNILWANTAQSEPQSSPGLNIKYCCIQDWTEGGEGNITDDPQFVEEFNQDFRLLHTSPCIDAGTTIAGLTSDYDGDPRPHGPAFDIGADEWDGIILPSPTPSFTRTPSETYTPVLTSTPTPSPTFTGLPPTPIPTPTDTRTPTFTATPTSTPTITDTPLPFADLSVSVVDDFDPAYATTDLSYVVTLHNAGPLAANAIILHVTFPASGNFGYLVPPPLNCSDESFDGEHLSCSMPTLAAGTSLTATYTIKVDSFALAADPDGSFTFEAYTVALTQDSDPSNNSDSEDTEIIASDLSAQVEMDQEVAFASEEVSYRVTVGNAGPSDAEVVRMTLDEVSSSAMIDADPGWFHAPPDGNNLEFVYPVLEPGTTTEIRITEFVEAESSGRFIRNADIYSNIPDANQSNNRDSGTVNIIQNLSHASPDARFAAVAAAGTNVYVVWQEVPPGNPSGNFNIFFTRSEDRGVTFTPPVNISNTTDLSRAPSVAASGENVYVAWHDEMTGEGSEVAMRVSSNGGVTFGPTIHPEVDPDQGSFYADLAVGENRVYVLWEGGGIWVRPYLFDGTPAGDAVQLDEQPNIFGGSKFAASGARVYVVWMSDLDHEEQEYDIRYSYSVNQGMTFTAPVEIADHGPQSWIPIPVIAAAGENVYIAWTEQEEGTRFVQSEDGGLTFNDPENLSELYGMVFPSLAAYGDRIHFAWSPFGITEVYFMAMTKDFEILAEPESIAGTREGIFRIRIAVSGPDVFVTWSEEIANLSDVYLWKRQIPLPVRVVYLVPNDRQYQPCYEQAIEEAVKHVQTWYRDDLASGNTFALHDPVVEVYSTPHDATYYATNPNGPCFDWFLRNVAEDGFALTGGRLNDPNYRWVFYIDADPGCETCDQGGGRAYCDAACCAVDPNQPCCDEGCVVVLPANDLRGLTGQDTFPSCLGTTEMAGRCRWVGGLAHELGHALSLHDHPECVDNNPMTICSTDYLMAGGHFSYPLPFLTHEERETLDRSPFFAAIEPDADPFDCALVADGCLKNDFSIRATPIQAIPNPQQLIEGKRTLLHIGVFSSFETTELVEIQLNYDSFSGPQQVIETHAIAPGKTDLYLPSANFILPPAQGFTARAEIRPDNQAIVDTVNSNNVSEIEFPVVSTKNFDVLAVAVQVPMDPAPPPSCGEVTMFGNGSRDLLEGTYPVSFPEFNLQTNCVPFVPTSIDAPLSDTEVRELEKQLDSLGWFGNYTRVVGILRQGLFNAHTSYTNAVGLAYSDLDGCLSEKQYTNGVVTVHEIGHTYELAYEHPANSGLVCSASGVDCGHINNVFASGYWVSKRSERLELDFMNSFVGATTTVDRWISEGTYNVLLGKLLENPTRKVARDLLSPYVIGISGNLTVDEEMTLDPCYRFLGDPDILLDNPGEYRILYLDQTGATLAETGFDISFDPPAEAPQSIVEDAVFSLTIPDVTGTAKLVIRDASGILAERVVSSHSPGLDLEKPNGGELYETGESLPVEWRTGDLDGDPLHAVVCISLDAGVHWIPLAMGLRAEDFQFVVPENFVTETGLLRVVVTDGFNTIEDVSDFTFAIVENTCPPGADPCRLLKLLDRIQKDQSSVETLFEKSLDWYDD
jgi:hypothetical protein